MRNETVKDSDTFWQDARATSGFTMEEVALHAFARQPVKQH